MIQSIIDKTMEYLSVPAVVGHEQLFMDFLESDYKKCKLSVYKHERYIVVSGAEPQSAIISAHIDRHGLISLGNDEYVYAAQYLKEIKYGVNNRLAQEQVQSIAERFDGEHIYAYDPATGEKLGQGKIETCNPCIQSGDAIFFVQDMDKISHGIPLAYARTARHVDDYLKGQIDNALSLGVVYELFRQGFKGTAILTTEEEIGKSWIHIQAYLEQEKIETKNLIILDTSPFTDEEPIKQGHLILRNRDMSEIFNTDLVQALKVRAEELGLVYQVKDEAMIASGKTVEQLGSTELGRLVQGTQGRWNGATIQIPTLMYHTSKETTTTRAIENYFLFLNDILVQNRLPMLEFEN
ncbi:MAG: hypothetical protein CMH29_00150 [Micavibrio sp.]|nr:hypothetical protein [Micavibrio sp.]|tara:strand:- start:6196 stop:7251 length:1056 start_codon:yes stop_codon:yes gene_type:complete